MVRYIRVLFLVSIFLNIYFIINFGNEHKRNTVTLEDNVSNQKSAIKKKIAAPENKTKKVDIEKKMLGSSEISDHFKDERSQEVEEAQNEKPELEDGLSYGRSQQDFYRNMEVELSLSPYQLETYKDLKFQREKEISDYLNPKIKQGQLDGDETFYLSIDDTVEMGKINDKYLQKLSEVFGEPTFNEYKKYLQSLNSKALSGDKDSRENHFIDF